MSSRTMSAPAPAAASASAALEHSTPKRRVKPPARRTPKIIWGRGGQGWLPQAGCAQGDMDCKNLWQEELKAALRHRRARSERKGAEQLPKP